MLYLKFLDSLIEKGVAGASRDYGDSSPPKLKGALDGFNACRGLQPPELHDLLATARKRVKEAILKDAPSETYLELRCYEAEVEWVCNCLSVALITLGRDPIVPPTASATMLANTIFDTIHAPTSDGKA